MRGEIAPDVLESCRRGDRDAFRLVYETYKDGVFSMALYFFRGDAATAADVTQQVFVKLMERIGGFQGQSDFSTWLHRLVTNTCIDRTRSPWRRAVMTDPVELDARPVQPSQEAEMDHQDRERAIQAALATLTPKIRMAIVLRYFQDLSYAEMASVLNCSVGTVASRLSKGHALLGPRLAAFSRRDSQ